MNEKDYPVSVTDFTELISGRYQFVDKTLMIRDLCHANGRVLFFQRPHLFGKTLNLSMIDRFFNIAYRDYGNLFENLRISEYPECMEMMNSYPAIRIDFGILKGSSDIESDLSKVVIDALSPYLNLAEQDVLRCDSTFIRRCRNMSLDRIETGRAIKRMCEILHRRHGRKTIVLLDNYDACIEDVTSVELCKKIAEDLRYFLIQTFKCNFNLHLGVIMGTSPPIRGGMTCGLNNISLCGIAEHESDTSFGFDMEEMMSLLDGLPEKERIYEEMAEWYGGYRFGDSEMLNPHCVMEYLRNGCEPHAFWSRDAGETIKWLIDLVEWEKIRDTTISGWTMRSDILYRPSNTSALCSFLSMVGILRASPTCNHGEGTEYNFTIVNRDISSLFEHNGDFYRFIRDHIEKSYHDLE